MQEIYAIDSTRISLREYWWGTKSPLVLIGWITKWLRIRIPGSTDDPNIESTQPYVVESLPDEVMERFRPLGLELGDMGFSDVAYHCIRDPGTRTTLYWATFIHESGSHFARIHQRIWSQSQKVSQAIFPVILTEFTDGTFFVSSSGKPDMLTPDSVRMNRMPGAAAPQLWAAHQAGVAEYGAQRLPVRIATADEALAATERHHVLLRDFNLERGVFRRRTAAEQARAESFAASQAQAQASGLRHGDVLAELEGLQQQKPNWTSTLWILLISIVAFAALGAARWDWKFTLWLIPILLFHEAGHWVAMRIFRYRNLRMFFIPLFGAAVTGRHWNVPGWKKGIVSLAGPIPGIAVGVVVAVAALVLNKPWLNELGFLLLILNGFNLLPVLPLDGGHVLHATLFCRNRWLDIVFRSLAAGALILMGLVLSRLLLWLGIGLALGLPLAFKIGKVVDVLRQTPLPPPLPDADRIPPETAEVIVDALKAEQPKGFSNKMLAQQTMSIYETLNARPPGVLGTLALLTVQGGAFFLCLVFCFLLVLGKFGGGFGNFMSSALRQPQHELSCEQPPLVWSGADASSEGGIHNLIVATLPGHGAAADAYTNLTRRLPDHARLMLFGDSLVLALPVSDDDARERWFNALRRQDQNAFVIVSNKPVTMSLFFIAPTETAATNMARELSALGALPSARLIAPWSPAGRTEAYTNFLQARFAWLDLDRRETEAWADDSVLRFNKRITDANRRGAMAEVERLSTARSEQVEKLVEAERQKVREQLSGTPAAALPDLYAKLSSLDYTNTTERAAVLRQIATLLGEEAARNGPSPGPGLQPGAFRGSAQNTGLIVEASWVSISDPQSVLPLLLNWLCDQGCNSIKYDFESYSFYDDMDDWEE